ncbi:MAG: single-stranded DNA-binding protein [Helicobacteraceae bacterium]|jgi:single-strand DNA-binding protein|nr:single-stranded DNA-binding protein [Helicobacteraceae bacterium]
MFNRVTFIGNLTRNVELRITENGVQIAKFGLAVNRHLGKGDNGEPKEEVMFIDVTVFGRAADLAYQYLAKGRKVLIDGRLQQDRWTTESGENRSRHIVIAETLQFLDSPNKETANGDKESGDKTESPNDNAEGETNNADHKSAKPNPTKKDRQ